MTIDMTGAKTYHHEAVYIYATWHTHMHVRSCVRVLAGARACAHMCTRVISEIEHPFSRYKLTY